MNEKTRGALEMSAAMMISGTIGWFVVMSGQPIWDVVFWRCFFGALTLLPICVAMGLFRSAITWRLLAIAAMGGVAIVLNWVLLFSAYSRVSISIATAVYSTQPFVLMGFGAFFLSERITIAKIAWLILAFCGMTMIVQGKPSAAYVGTDYFVGILLALGAAFLWAVAAIITKKLKGTSPTLIAFIQVCVGVILLWPFANLTQPSTDTNTWVLLVAMGVIHTGGMYILLYGAIQKLPTPMQGVLSFIYPIAAIVVDVMAFSHRLSPVQYLGATAILLAAAGITLGWTFKPRSIKTDTPS
jgi:drug/metabolite transporter (DMT)-like permease